MTTRSTCFIILAGSNKVCNYIVFYFSLYLLDDYQSIDITSQGTTFGEIISTTLLTTGDRLRTTEREILCSSSTFSNLHSKTSPSTLKPTNQDVTITHSPSSKDISTMTSKTGSTLNITSS